MIASALEPHRTVLTHIAYRMVGTLQDAEDVVQETFLRALAAPPSDLTRDLRPWLVRVAMNLSRDRLRRRKTADYAGAWLPEPLPLGRLGSTDAADAALDVRYAWMVAVEALTPEQRAVVVLRDVLERDATEAAQVLESTPQAVRALHTRARRALAEHAPVAASTADGDNASFSQLLAALGTGDPEQVRALLRDDARMRADAGGRYAAAGVPLDGAERVSRVLVALGRRLRPADQISVVEVLGRPAIHVRRVGPLPPSWAPANVLIPVFAANGQIAAFYNVLVDEKLGAYAA
jgi:RNA polymerase sigma-70 factor (ECF subfamily)